MHTNEAWSSRWSINKSIESIETYPLHNSEWAAKAALKKRIALGFNPALTSNVIGPFHL